MARNARVDAAAASVGFTKHWGIDIDSQDSQGMNTNPSAMLDRLRSELQKCPKSKCQILFHDFPSSLRSMKKVIPALISDGYDFTSFP